MMMSQATLRTTVPGAHLRDSDCENNEMLRMLRTIKAAVLLRETGTAKGDAIVVNVK